MKYIFIALTLTLAGFTTNAADKLNTQQLVGKSYFNHNYQRSTLCC